MHFIDFISSDQNFLFVLSFVLLFLFLFLEFFSLVIGSTFLGLFNSSQIDSDFDFEVPVSSLTPMTSIKWLFSFCFVSGMPFIIYGMIFLVLFGSIGLLLQDASLNYYGTLQPIIPISFLSLLISHLLTKLIGKGLVKLNPKEKNLAISWKSLIGTTAFITLGEASVGYPAQAKAKDKFGKYHHFMIEPENDEIFSEGEKILLVRCVNGLFFGKKI